MWHRIMPRVWAAGAVPRADEANELIFMGPSTVMITSRGAGTKNYVVFEPLPQRVMVAAARCGTSGFG
jgi:hypothetical protein